MIPINSKFRHSKARTFTLLEVMIALGVLAFGLAAALSLFAAAATSGRRAELLVQSSHCAELVFSEVEAKLTSGVVLEDFPKLTEEDLKELGLDSPENGDAPQRAGQAAPADSAAPGSNPDAPIDAPIDDSGSSVSPEPFEPRAVLANYSPNGFEDFKVWAVLSPLEGEVDPPTALLCEVFIRWSQKGQRRMAQYQSVVLRRLSALDLPR